jgi:hypothetical protein
VRREENKYEGKEGRKEKKGRMTKQVLGKEREERKEGEKQANRWERE